MRLLRLSATSPVHDYYVAATLDIYFGIYFGISNRTKMH